MSSSNTPLNVDRQSLKTEEAAGRHESDSSWFGWIREVSRYQWLVLIVAWLGWVFDAMDGALFSLDLSNLCAAVRKLQQGRRVVARL